jgi:hypothetical protein
MPKEASKKQSRRACAPEPDEEAPPDAQVAATGLLVLALRIGQKSPTS